LKAVKSLVRNLAKPKGYSGDLDDPIILVHDGARPLVTLALIRKIIQAAQKYGAAIPGLVPRDTVKLVSRGGGVIRETLDRNRLREVQTPQGFRLSTLQEAYRVTSRDNFTATDDAALVERIGYPVRVISGDPRNIKITTRLDLKVAEILLAM
jgi:2-C-methyl-D-erythritol 4-phosphate cytidylyltransferase